MASRVVIELDAKGCAAVVADGLADWNPNGAVGVLVKGSQGDAWSNPHALDVLEMMAAKGLYTGWLHYTTPGTADAFDESAAILQDVKDLSLPLGVWLEVEDTQGRPAHELTEWLKDMVAGVQLPTRPVAVMLTEALRGVVQMPPECRREVLVGEDPVGVTPWWARRVAVPSAPLSAYASAYYELTSTRGLNPPETEDTEVDTNTSTTDTEHEDDAETESTDTADTETESDTDTESEADTESEPGSSESTTDTQTQEGTPPRD